jgi:hypothetical protein
MRLIDVYKPGTKVVNKFDGRVVFVSSCDRCQYGYWTVIKGKDFAVASTLDSLIFAGWKAQRINSLAARI